MDILIVISRYISNTQRHELGLMCLIRYCQKPPTKLKCVLECSVMKSAPLHFHLMLHSISPIIQHQVSND